MCRFWQSVRLAAGQEVEVALMPPLSRSAYGIVSILCEPPCSSVHITKVQWGDRKRDAAVLFPGEAVYLTLRNDGPQVILQVGVRLVSANVPRLGQVSA